MYIYICIIPDRMSGRISGTKRHQIKHEYMPGSQAYANRIPEKNHILSARMPDRMSDGTLDKMPERIPEYIDHNARWMSEHMPDRMSDSMSEYMSENVRCMPQWRSFVGSRKVIELYLCANFNSPIRWDGRVPKIAVAICSVNWIGQAKGWYMFGQE